MSKTKSGNTSVSLIRSFQEKIRFGLVFQSIRYRLIRYGFEFTPFYLMQEGINLVEKIPVISGQQNEYSLEFLGDEDMKIVAFNSGLPEERPLYLLKTGQKCVGLRHNGKITAFLWINLKEIEFGSLKMPLKSNEAYLWDMYTIDSYRGKNLAPFLRFKTYEILKKMGREVLYSVSVCFNKPTIKCKKKLNAKPLKLMMFIELFHNYRWCFKLKSY